MFEGEEKTLNFDANSIKSTNGKGSNPTESKYKLNPSISLDASVHSGRSIDMSGRGKPTGKDAVTPTKNNRKKKDRPKTSFFHQIFDTGNNNSKDNSAGGGGGVGGGTVSPLFDQTGRRKSSTEKIVLAASVLGQMISGRGSLANSPIIDDDGNFSTTQTIIPGTALLKMASHYFRRDSHHSDEANSAVSSKRSVSSSRKENNHSGRKSFANVIRMSLHGSLHPSMQPSSGGPPSRNASFSVSRSPKGFVRLPGRYSHTLSTHPMPIQYALSTFINHNHSLLTTPPKKTHCTLPCIRNIAFTDEGTRCPYKQRLSHGVL